MVGITENVDEIISTGLGTISSPAFPHFCQKQNPLNPAAAYSKVLLP